MKKRRPVLIHWVDSLQPVSGWSMLGDAPKLEVANCSSVGWIISQNKDAIMIAQNVADLESTDAQGSGFMRIPQKCILKKINL